MIELEANRSVSGMRSAVATRGFLSLITVSFFGVACGQAVGMDEYRDAGPTPDAVPVGPPQWAMAGANPQRNGRSEYAGPAQGRYEMWALAGVEDLVIVDAVGPDGTVYVVIRPDGTDAGQLVAVEPDGTARWVFPEDDSLVLGGVALTATGRLLFEGAQFLDGPDPWELPCNVFFDVDVSGALRWAWQPSNPPAILTWERHSAPWYDEAGNTYVALQLRTSTGDQPGESYLYSFGPDGRLRWRWERNLGGPIWVQQPAMSPGGTIYVAVSPKGGGEHPDPEVGLYALSQDGDEQWFAPYAHDHVFHALAVGDDGTAYVVSGVAGIDATTLAAIGPDGDTDWTFSLPLEGFHSITTSIAVAPDGTLYLGAARYPPYEEPSQPPYGGVLALTPEGAVAWSTDTELVPHGGLAVDVAGAVYVYTRATTSELVTTSRPMLVALEPEGVARQAYELEEEHAFWSPFPGLADVGTGVVLASGGRIYRGSRQGILHVIQPSSP